MLGGTDGDWREWVAEAHQVIHAWEAETSGRLLSSRDAVGLAEFIARALQAAFERGRSPQPSRPVEDAP
jgi:hypothetical protein